jgi:hypothetical protein
LADKHQNAVEDAAICADVICAQAAIAIAWVLRDLHVRDIRE